MDLKRKASSNTKQVFKNPSSASEKLSIKSMNSKSNQSSMKISLRCSNSLMLLLAARNLWNKSVSMLVPWRNSGSASKYPRRLWMNSRK